MIEHDANPGAVSSVDRGLLSKCKSLANAVAMLDACNLAVSWCLIVVTGEPVRCDEVHLGLGAHKQLPAECWARAQIATGDGCSTIIFSRLSHSQALIIRYRYIFLVFQGQVHQLLHTEA